MVLEFLPHVGGLAVLLALSAFFSGSETALFSLGRAQVQRLRQTGGRTGRKVAELLAFPRRLLITILVGNMVVNVAAASIVATLATRLLGDQGVWAAIFVATLLLLICGEVTPKTFAVRHAVVVARAVAFPLDWFAAAISPIRLVLRHITNAVLFVLRQGRIQSRGLLTRREFTTAFEVGQAEGVIDALERDLVRHIFEFHQMDARELMVPRTEIVSIEETATIQQAIELSHQCGHSRLPVHNGELDQTWGTFDIRDLPAWRGHEVQPMTIAGFVAYRDGLSEAPRRPLVRPAFLVPETRHVVDLLHDMRTRGPHMAILVDEYGGTAGLVTLRQLVDELVGGVLATGRNGAPLYVKRPRGIEVLGEARVRDVNEDLGLGLPLGIADTIGGYVLSLFGDLPKEGEEVCDDRFVFAIARLDGRRIDAVVVRPRGRAAEQAQEAATPSPGGSAKGEPGPTEERTG